MIRYVVACAALALPATGVAETSASQAPLAMHGHLPPYVDPAKMPDTVAILPSPPVDPSTQQAADQATFAATRGLNGSGRWALATRDANLAEAALADDFSCAAGVRLTPASVPSLFRIMDRAKADVSIVYSKPKQHYNRRRPFVGNDAPICVPRDPGLAGNGSYPSGHTTIGDALALILAEAAPDRAGPILSRGRAFGESRVICGVHWATDVEAGFLAASTAVASMQSSADFRADIESLRHEIASAPAGGLDAGECAAQADAIAHSVLNR